jgi:hypothetical protein
VLVGPGPPPRTTVLEGAAGLAAQPSRCSSWSGCAEALRMSDSVLPHRRLPVAATGTRPDSYAKKNTQPGQIDEHRHLGHRRRGIAERMAIADQIK